MSGPLFDPERCDVPEVPAPNFAFIDDCEVRPAPAAIYDCPEADIPIDTQPATLCTTIDAAATVEATTGPPSAEVITTRTADVPGSLCAYSFDFHFELPGAVCPSLVVGTASVVDSGPPEVTVEVNRTGDPSDCEFTFDFLFVLPEAVCPQLVANANTVVGTSETTPAAVVVVNQTGDPSDCEFTFDFEFTLPRGTCPNLAVNYNTVVVDSEEDPSATVAVNRTGEMSDCEFTFDFEFNLPRAACPTLEVSQSVNVVEGALPNVVVAVNRTGEESDCEHTFDFEFTLPPAACPTLNVTQSVDFTTGAPDVEVTVTRVNSESGCSFNLDFHFVLPIGGDGSSDMRAVTLTSNMIGGSATFLFDDSLAPGTGFDPSNMFKCAMAGARGLVQTNPFTSTLQFIGLQEKANWIRAELTEDMAGGVSENATIIEMWVHGRAVQDPDPDDLGVDIFDPANLIPNAQAEDEVVAVLDCANNCYNAISGQQTSSAGMWQATLTSTLLFDDADAEFTGGLIGDDAPDDVESAANPHHYSAKNGDLITVARKVVSGVVSYWVVAVEHHQLEVVGNVKPDSALDTAKLQQEKYTISAMVSSEDIGTATDWLTLSSYTFDTNVRVDNTGNPTKFEQQTIAMKSFPSTSPLNYTDIVTLSSDTMVTDVKVNNPANPTLLQKTTKTIKRLPTTGVNADATVISILNC